MAEPQFERIQKAKGKSTFGTYNMSVETEIQEQQHQQQHKEQQQEQQQEQQ